MSRADKPRERRLLRLFGQLSRQNQDTLVAFAEFLSMREEPARPAAPPPPNVAPRPAKETVVGAIKRLSAGYSMLDRAQMLNQTSSLMAQHVMHGRAAADVIDELEKMFEAHYQALVQSWDEDQ